MKLNEVNNVLTLKLVLSHQAEMLNSVQFKVNLKQPTVKQNNQGSLLFSTPCQMELAQTALSWERLCDVDEAKWNVALFRQIAAVAFALADVPKLDRSCVRIAVSLTESSNNVYNNVSFSCRCTAQALWDGKSRCFSPRARPRCSSYIFAPFHLLYIFVVAHFLWYFLQSRAISTNCNNITVC